MAGRATQPIHLFAADVVFEEEPPHYTKPVPPSSGWQSFADAYARLFSVHELEQSVLVQGLFVAVLIGFYATFSAWSVTSNIGHPVPWPWFPAAVRLWPWTGAHAHRILFLCVAGWMLLTVWAALVRCWRLAHAGVLVLLVFKAAFLLMRSDVWGNYHLFHLVYTAIFVFSQYKLYFMRRTFVMFYVLAGSIKLHAGWTAGTYFSALEHGLPIFPDALIPAATNGVLFLELVLGYFLLSTNRLVQRFAFVSFVLFHLYSVALVGYLYPVTLLPLVCVCFGPNITPTRFPWRLSSAVPITLYIVIFTGQLTRLFFPHDPYLTNLGNAYGVFMFEANHQVIGTATSHFKDGTALKHQYVSTNSMGRPDPARASYEYKRTLCRAPNVVTVELQMDSSINGGPFHRIVDEKNICTVTLNAFTENSWVRHSELDAPIVGYPVRNDMVSSPFIASEKESVLERIDPATGRRMLIPPALRNNSAPTLSPVQQALIRHQTFIVFLWIDAALSAFFYFLLSSRSRPRPAKESGGGA